MEHDQGWSVYMVADTVAIRLSPSRRALGWPSDYAVSTAASEMMGMRVTLRRAIEDEDEALYERTYGTCALCGATTSATVVERCGDCILKESQ